ncbi:two pore domain potassium channel family protein [Candidatus Woesearchaeota archaeon]|nr:two pore domain potassium channel family protein [Candidatus Woesearchaeota archaeon]
MSSNSNGRLRIAITTLFLLLVFGTTFYHFAEGWTWAQAFYFTSVTLTTIGYGDIHPTTDFTRIFTALFAITGVAIALYSLTMVGAHYFERREQELITEMKKETTQESKSIASTVLKADEHVAGLLKKLDARIKK